MSINASDIKNYILDKQKTVIGASSYEFKLLDKPFDKVTFADSQAKLIKDVAAFGDTDTNYRYWALANKEVTDAIFRSGYTANSDSGLKTDLSTTNDPSAKAFLLYTESPFYYFYDALKYRYQGLNGGFKSALLMQQVFNVTDSDVQNANGKTRDFLDLQGLFTDVIPYLAQANQYVDGWTSVNGKSIEGYDFANGTYSQSSQAQYIDAQNKKAQLQQVWNIYSPWVDGLYDLDVMNKKAGIARKKVTVANTLNPGAYDEVGRPMIWSEADMTAKNYNVSDLTDIEMRMQRVLNNTAKDLMYLTNYHDLDDEVLITAAAMFATFNFDREFSQTNIVGNSVTLYPQGFELKNFNYDAFMRLTLMNSTGESIMGDQDLYVRILSKTSFFTGLFLIVEDLLAVVIIPAAKMIVLLMLLFLGLLMCVSSVVNPPEKLLKTLSNSFLMPTVLFMIFSMAFSFVVSLFTGEGLTAYVGNKMPSITTNDPTITILLLIVVGILYSFALGYLIKILFSSLKSYAVNTFFGTVSVAAGAGSIMYNRFKKGMGSAISSMSGAIERRSFYNNITDAVKDGHSGKTNEPVSNMSNEKRYNSGYLDGKGIDSVKSPSKDSTLEEDIKNLSSGKKTIAEKIIDTKYAIHDTLHKPEDITLSTYDDMRNKARTVVNTAKDVASGKYVTDYFEKAKEYDTEQRSRRVKVLEDKKARGETVRQSRIDKERAKLPEMKDKN